MVEFDQFYAEDGEPIRRFLPVEEILVPAEVRLSDDEARLEVPDFEEYWLGGGRVVSVNERCLFSFIKLGDASSEEILRFARKWGLLGLCPHGEPATGHFVRRREVRLPPRGTLIPPSCQEQDSEKIEDWRRFAGHFDTVLELSASLRDRKSSGRAHLWERLPVSKHLVDTRPEQELLATFVNAILTASAIQPAVSWGTRATIQFACPTRTSLFAALAFELAMAVADFQIALCSYCQSSYKPQRRPKPGEANSCPSCRQRASAERVRRSRHKKTLRDTAAGGNDEETRTK